MKLLRKLPAVLLLLGGSATFILVVAEVSLRKKSGTNTVIATSTGESFQAPIFERHPYLIVYNKKHMALPNVHTNSVGFRGSKEYPHQKPAGVKRVVVLGGSGAVGYNASSDDTTMPAQLERYLNEKVGNVEVINAACSGFNSHQDLILLATEIISYQPDLIVTFAGGTDINTSMQPAWVPGYHELLGSFDRLEHHPWYEHSHALNKIAKWIKPAKQERITGVLHPEVVQNYLSNVSKMAILATGQGIGFLNVVQPALIVSTKQWTPREHQLIDEWNARGQLPVGYESLAKTLFAKLSQSGKTLSLPSRARFLDASDLFAGQSFEAFSDAYHLTDEGYRFAAEKIGQTILADRLLAPTATSAARHL